MIHALQVAGALAYPRYRDGDVVTRVGGVGGELGVEDLRRVGYGAELGHAGRQAGRDARAALLAAYEGDRDADVRVRVGLYLDDVRALHHGVGADRRYHAVHGSVDGGPGPGPDVEG